MRFRRRALMGQTKGIGYKGLCFTAAQDNSSVSYHNNGTNAPDMEYSQDGNNWVQWNADTAISLDNNELVYVRGNNPNGFSNGTTNYTNFVMSGKIKQSGSFMSLLDQTGETKDIPKARCFHRLFYHCSSLIQIEFPLKELIGAYFSAWVDGVAPVGTFICREDMPIQISTWKVPSRWRVKFLKTPQYYTCEKLDFNGSHVIDLGYVANNNTGIKIDCTVPPNNNDDNLVFGSRNGISGDTRFSIDFDWTANDVVNVGWNSLISPKASLVGKADTRTTAKLNWLNNRKFSIFNEDISDIATTLAEQQNSISIGGWNTTGAPGASYHGSIYNVQVSQGSNIVMNLSPRVLASDMTPCFYDSVNDYYYFDTKLFSQYNNFHFEVQEIPGYKFVNYLSATRTEGQFFNIGIIPQTKSGIKFEGTASSDNPIGVYVDSTHKFYIDAAGGGYNDYYATASEEGEMLNFLNNRKLISESHVINIPYDTLNEIDILMYMFALNNDGNPLFPTGNTIRLVLLSLDQEITNKYSAVVRTSDNKPGMLDLVNNEFHINQGTGADFNYG